jgi:hypothetical protein
MRRRQLPGKRISRAYFQSTDRPRPELSGKSFMLWRDLQTGMMRFGAGRGNVRIRLAPHDPQLEDWVVALIDIGQFQRGSLPEAVPAFVEQVANHLGYDGEGFFEIVVGANDDAPAPTVLAPLPSGEVKRRGGDFLQVLPAEDREPGGPDMLHIPASRMWHIELPRELGSPNEHRAMLVALARQEPIAGFALEDGQLGASQGYDFSEHRRAADIATERATRAWGTIPSLQQIDGTTEYYYIARSLQFMRSQALVGEHIMAELNSLLRRLGVSAQIHVEGLPTAALIAEYIAKLEKGEMSFTTALQASRGY